MEKKNWKKKKNGKKKKKRTKFVDERMQWTGVMADWSPANRKREGAGLKQIQTVPIGSLSPQTKFQDERMKWTRETMVDPLNPSQTSVGPRTSLWQPSCSCFQLVPHACTCLSVWHCPCLTRMHCKWMEPRRILDWAGDIEKSKSRMRFSKVSWVAGRLDVDMDVFSCRCDEKRGNENELETMFVKKAVEKFNMGIYGRN